MEVLYWLGGLACFAVFAIAAFLCAKILLADLASFALESVRRVRRRPSFGLGTALLFLLLWSMTFALVRWGARGEYWEGILIAGVIAFVICLGIVAAVSIAIDDFREVYARRRLKSVADNPFRPLPDQLPTIQSKPDAESFPPPEIHST